MAYTPEGGIFAGTVYLDVYDTVTGQLTGERDVGNTQNLTFDPPGFEKKERFGKRVENFGKVVDSVLLKQTRAMKFTLDDIYRENLVLAMFGEGSVLDVSAGSVSDEEITARLDKAIKLAKRRLKSTPAVEVGAETPTTWQSEHGYVLTDFVQPTVPNTYRYECTTAGTSGTVEPTWPTTLNATVNDGTVVWTCRKLTYVEDADYEVEYTAGMITVLSGGDIEDSQTLLVSYDHDAYTGYKVQAGKLTKIDARLRLVGKNIINNDDVEVLVHKASLFPSGGIDWITDDYATLEFTGDIQALGGDTWDVTVLSA